jgi:hypothetical protein
MEPETITIPKKDYEALQADSLWLGCLEEAGVDNWSGISEAFTLKKQYAAEEKAAAAVASDYQRDHEDNFRGD